MVNGVEVIMDNSTTSIVKLPDPAAVTPTATPLSAIADAFENLGKLLNHGDLPLDAFYEACSFVSVLFNCLGFAFKFAELEYVSKLEGLMEASPACSNLKDVIEVDVANKTVKSPGSYSRNLRRVRQGIDLIRAIFEQLLATDDSCLKDIASTAYGQICAPYHTWAVRTAVHAGMYTLPTREQLFLRLNETEQSAEKKMKRYMDAAKPVIEYVDNLYLSRDITLDW